MKKSSLNITSLMLTITSLFLSLTIVHAEEEAKLSFSKNEVAPGLYMLMGVGGFTGGNLGLSVGDDGVVLIDDSMPPSLDIMKQAIASITDKPIDFLINTHVHRDHTGNNEALGNDGTWIVAHENMRLAFIKKGVDTPTGNVPTPKAALPVITFRDSMDFHLNGYTAQIIHLANAHTNGDLIIHYKEANVIHTGDIMFNGLFPYIDISNGGSVDGYIAAQKKIIELANADTKIIPGHGPLANQEALKESLAMLIDSRSIIITLIKAGKSEKAIVALNPLSKYHDQFNWGFITTEKMTKQLFKSLSASN